MRSSWPVQAIGPAIALSVLSTACTPVAGDPTDLAAVSRTEPPPPLGERPIAFPDFEEIALPNGMRLVIVPHGTQPVANLSLYVTGGASTDPRDRGGRAELAADVLTKGTDTRSAIEISESIEGVGGSLSAWGGNDWITVSASVLAEHLPLAVDLVADVTRNPSFPDEEVALSRTRWLSALEAELGEPNTIAERRFLREVYGADHPYGSVAGPTTVGRLDRSDLVSYHEQHVVPGRALLVVSGRVARDEVETLAREHFGDWTTPGTGAAAGTAGAGVSFPSPASVERTRIALVHRPGSVQSTIQMGHLSMRPGDPDFFPMLVLNRVVGGGADSRLFRILREERGWSYGAYSGMTRPMDIGYFVAQAEVRTEVTGPAVVEMLHQLRRIRDDVVPEAEFAAARDYLHGSFPLRLETASGVASQIAQNRLLGLPIDQLRDYRDHIAAVTPDEVQRVARERIDPDAVVIVVVGDGERIRGELEEIARVEVFGP
jgi:zinc protease